MKQSEKHERNMVWFTLGAILMSSIAAFCVNKGLGFTVLALWCLALAGASYSCNKDALKEETNPAPTNDEETKQ